MNGKKFVMYFVVVTVLTAIGLYFGIKNGYETRPAIKIEEPAN